MALARKLYIGSRLERVMGMMRGEGRASATTSTSVDLLCGIPAEALEGDRQSGVRRSRVEGREGAGGKRFKTAKKTLRFPRPPFQTASRSETSSKLLSHIPPRVTKFMSDPYVNITKIQRLAPKFE